MFGHSPLLLYMFLFFSWFFFHRTAISMQEIYSRIYTEGWLWELVVLAICLYQIKMFRLKLILYIKYWKKIVFFFYPDLYSFIDLNKQNIFNKTKKKFSENCNLYILTHRILQCNKCRYTCVCKCTYRYSQTTGDFGFIQRW